MMAVLKGVDVFVVGDICFDETKLAKMQDNKSRRVDPKERPLPSDNIEENLLRLESLRSQSESQSPARGNPSECRQYDDFQSLKI